MAYLIFIPLRKQKSMIFTIMATIMFGKVIMEGACLIWGGNAFTIPDFMSGTYQIGNAVISKSNLFLIIAAIVIVALLQFYLQKTKPGKAMRCVAQNRTAASIVGIDVNRNMAITIAISTVICCCIGILVVPLYNVSSVSYTHLDVYKRQYMPYAMSVIVSRAIPEIDGFKPSHRKLLYTMYKMGLLNGGRTKSANIVGQTMRLNPHGDAAIYETMVRLAREMCIRDRPRAARRPGPAGCGRTGQGKRTSAPCCRASQRRNAVRSFSGHRETAGC